MTAIALMISSPLKLGVLMGRIVLRDSFGKSVAAGSGGPAQFVFDCPADPRR
jgi:hypothetical protein